MNDIYRKIESIEIPMETHPKNEDYKRGFCLYRLVGYMQSRYVIYEEPLEGFNEDSKIYKFGISILRQFNLNPEEWTLLYHNDVDWVSTFKLIKK